MALGDIIKIVGGGIVIATGVIIGIAGVALTPIGIGVPLGVAAVGVASIGAGNVVSGIGGLVDDPSAPPAPSTLGQTITGTEGDDVLKGTEFPDKIYGLGGNDRLVGFGGNDEIYGGQGDDVIEGGEGDDTLYGEEGFNKLFGDNGDDTLYGGPDGNMLVGGYGKDVLNGGLGRDRFLFYAMDDDPSVDVIEGFELGKDRLEIPRAVDAWRSLVFPQGQLGHYLSVQLLPGSNELEVSISPSGKDYQQRTIAILKDPGHSMSELHKDPDNGRTYQRALDDLEYRVILEHNNK